MGMMDRLLEERDGMKVEKGDMVHSTGTAVYADDLGSCLGVAAYDPKNGECYLAHLSTYGNDDIHVELEKVEQELQRMDTPYEVVAGGTMNPGMSPVDDAGDVREAREHAEEIIEELDTEGVIAWNRSPSFNRMIADPEYGILYDSFL